RSLHDALPILPKLVPAPDLLTEAEYDARISQVEAYLRKYPRSLKKNEASKILEQLETERKAVADGGVKFGGKIIPASERNPQAYALDEIGRASCRERA